MPHAKMTHEEWLKKHVDAVADLGEFFDDEGEMIAYPPHTVLKVICVRYYADMFAKVAMAQVNKGRRYDGAVYLDLFAGPGVVMVDGHKGPVAGSPIAATTADHNFMLAVCVEIDRGRSASLQRRLGSYLPAGSFKVFNSNSNKDVGRVIDYVSQGFKNPIVFAFIDPQGMEASWSTVEALSRAFPAIDFMINITEGASRVAGRIGAGMEGDRPIFEDFFGPNANETLMRINKGEQVDEAYSRNVREVLGRPVGKSITIRRKGNQVAYHLLCYTRASYSGSPWAVSTLATLKDHIERVDGDTIADMLEVAKNRQDVL